MLWIIALLVIGLIGIAGYRFYFKPPLSKVARQQRESYIQRLKYGRTLVYHMPAYQISELTNQLKKIFRFTKIGCYYGSGVMIQLHVDESEVIMDLFCPTEDHLTKYLWHLTRLKNRIGGTPNGTPHG